jgi:hemolysin-activating ACP:hemolysin acyltransferase
MLADVRTQFQANIGEVAVAMANMPRYRDLRLGDLIHILVEPMLRHRVAIAKASSEGRTMGVAIWASVSREVDADIRQQVQAGVFPIRLKQEDWNSGDSYWLLDLIAPTQAAATAVLASFRQVVGDNPVHMHPMVSGLVDPQVLSAMRVRPQPSQAQAACRHCCW